MLEAAVVIAILLSVPRSASPYQCTAVLNANPPLTQGWVTRCIPYMIQRGSTLLGGEERRQLIAQSFRAWSMNACTDLELLDAGYTDDGPGFDPRSPSRQTNVILSVDDPASLSLFPDPDLLAITLTSFSKDTGEIFDADILLNAVRFEFEDVEDFVGCDPGRKQFDLRNTLVHEMGHFLGYDHDRNVESTMFASAMPCEIKKRDLSDDDRLGVCTVYGAGRPTRTCAPPPDYDTDGVDTSALREQCERVTGGGRSCACARASSSGRRGGGLVLFALVLLIRTHHRTRRPRAPMFQANTG